MMPQGFPLGHSRFWINSLLPLLSAAVCVLGIYWVIKKQYRRLKCLGWVFISAVMVSWVTALWVFPQSAQGKFLLAISSVAIVATVSFALMLLLLRKESLGKASLLFSVLAGGLLGFFLSASQRAADSATRPYHHEAMKVVPEINVSSEFSVVLSQRVAVSPAEGEVSLNFANTRLNVLPLLTFDSRSPDRFWTIFAPYKARSGPDRILKGVRKDAGSLVMLYEDDAVSILKVALTNDTQDVQIEAQSYLPQDVYSHLNTFCEIHINTVGALSLSFSPCPQEVEMKAFDYPAGRPARLAYLDAADKFHVVEASSGEKGPFKTLQQGSLKRDQPLKITIYSDGVPQCRITLRDWAAQTSTQLSPTAGWGLPENAIEFSLFDGDRKNSGVISLTLAATSTGRGWDSVGHGAGSYRNRMEIEMIDR